MDDSGPKQAATQAATPASPAAAPADERPSLLSRLRWPLMIGGPLIVAIVVAWFVITGGRYQSTDDAYVQADRTPVSSSVSGRVVEVDVKENQRVQAGQVLFKLDAQTFAAALEDAEAQYAAAKLQVNAQKAAYGQQVAGVQAAQDTIDYTAREAARDKTLVDAGIISRQQYDQAVHAADQAKASAAAVREQAVGALATLGGNPNIAVEAHPTVLQAKAMLDRAKLNLSYTTIVAAQSGIVTHVDQMPVGTYINAAQPVFWLVSGEPWVEANFKENQLAKMKIGQPVEIKVDAVPGQTFRGYVASFSPGTGTTFSALPAQNGTGNWVKVVQRLPVRINFDRPPPDMASHAGLSAKTKVDTRSDAKQPAGARPR
ncbi:MAG TPA: HlyD family secretion protein [Caulobacteraceae bacterium]